MRPALALVTLILATPLAAAWPVTLLAPVDPELSVRSSLLVAGALHAEGAGVFAAPVVSRAGFGDALTVTMCPDRQGQPDAACGGGAQGPQHTAARVRVLAGGIVVRAVDAEPIRLDAEAAPAALGGDNLTLNAVDLPPSLFVGGAGVVRSNGTGFLVRPLGEGAAIEVRGDEGFRTYNGTDYTLVLAGAADTFVEAGGLVLGMPDNATLTVRQAPLRVAEASLRLDGLHALLRAVVPPERADRRADIAQAYGPFQVAPALLDGVVAAAANLSLDGARRDGFLLVRVADLAVRHEAGNWTASGNATYLVEGSDLLPRPGATDRLPLVACGLLGLAAVAGRAATRRETPPRPRRVLHAAVVLAGLAFLVLVAVRALAALLGVDALADRAALSDRSEAQLLLLASGMALTAVLLVGLSAGSLARSLLSLLGRPAARAVPALAAVFVAAIFLFV
ncbi:MAG TPA: hypothetical protein VHH36_06040, partial [Candidatus Thermoplasmatota archaeon]|nr:hypothetical protein [Candidatus Thermoplasmatota archaeon]